MEVVDKCDNIREIEDTIAGGLVEELIFQAHNEIKLLRIMKNWKPWEYLQTNDFEQKEALNNMMSMKNTPLYQGERYDNLKHTPNARKPTASVHPEDKQ